MRPNISKFDISKFVLDNLELTEKAFNKLCAPRSALFSMLKKGRIKQ